MAVDGRRARGSDVDGSVRIMKKGIHGVATWSEGCLINKSTRAERRYVRFHSHLFTSKIIRSLIEDR